MRFHFELFRFFLSRHPQSWEKIEYLLFVVYELNSFGVQPHEMSAVFPTFAPDAGIDAEQVRIGAIDAFSERDADFRHGDMA
jgi:hypothetical protein